MDPTNPGRPVSPPQQLTHKNGPATYTQHIAPSTTKKSEPILRRRKTPIFLLIIYLPTLVVPWVLVCVMTKRPLGSSSYYDQTSTHYTSNAAGIIVANLLKTINAVLAVPIISALLANAAIVYAMRRRPDQKLNIQQLFALADKGWSNYLLLWNANSRGRSSRFLWLAALLVALGAILQPLISVLVTFEEVTATTCLDIPFKHCSLLGPATIAYDPEPADMPRLQRDLILQDVLGHLVTVSDVEPQPNLWPVNPDTIASNFINGYTTPPDRRMFSSYSTRFGENPDGFFVTALENGTNTGVLREHAIRLNSSVHCEHIPQSDLPSPCSGARPLEIHLDRQGLKLDVCAPGNTSQFPFTASRHRQDISEDLYIHLEAPRSLARAEDNFTVHCTASTSRGYFELGNEQNQYIYGSLLDRWPDPDDIAKNFNDYRSELSHSRPSEEDPPTSDDSALYLPGERSIGFPFDDIYYQYNPSVPGPLMVSAEALFGNYSFLQFATNNSTGMTPTQAIAGMCEHGSIPFSQVTRISTLDQGPESYCSNVAYKAAIPSYADSLDEDLSHIIASHVRIFNDTGFAEYALGISMYFANRAVLTKTVSAERQTFDARPIFSSPGTVMARPKMATASMVVLTVLIFLQTLGLAIITWLIYSVPTWAPTLGAMEVARIGKALSDEDLPPLGPVTRRDEIRLTKIDGLVGMMTVDRVEDKDEAEAGIPLENVRFSVKTSRAQLALGGKGLIAR